MRNGDGGGAPPLYAAGDVAPPAGAETFWLKASDGMRLRAAFWPARGPSRGAVLLLQGRTEFLEKFYEPVERLLGMGFSVLTFDWRGQGLSERPLRGERMRRRGYVRDFGDYQRDMDAALKALQERAPDGPWLLVAHSMGGAIAARTLMRQQAGGAKAPPGPGFTAAIFSAPMLGLYGSGGGASARMAAGFANLFGMGSAYATGSDRHFPDELKRTDQIKNNPLTSDLERFEKRYFAFLREHPELAIGGATWSWLLAARREQAQLKPTAIPLLVFLGDAETVVSSEAVETYAKGNPNAVLMHLKNDVRHEPFLEKDPVQEQVWAGIAGFASRWIPKQGL